MKLIKEERQKLLRETIDKTPFITDEQLADKFSVSVQTIRLDRMELKIPELRKRMEYVATDRWNETVKSLPLEEVIGDIIDLQLDKRAISVLDIRDEHVFSRNKIARGHHLFAQANSLAVAVMDDELALTARSELRFIRQVKMTERVIAKATVKGMSEKGLTTVKVESFVDHEPVFTGLFHMFRTTDHKGERDDANSD